MSNQYIKIKLTADTAYQDPATGGHKDGRAGEIVETTIQSGARLVDLDKGEVHVEEP